uniref:Uncharacterized protein n=1 Tax=Chromera velia CCMP2878 TaxID=1169474 RepID=A0A0G4GYN6_9ALVE|mmetsp:Transcript_17690/g.35919  ORF Transcript_17690/g.35919 Transcript_17690/m.35919 type:complete len:83 (-) Transcript_17690:333-581(-)|eukprot:Cvel_23870.t1-p1 / transcript=Cvel_23870.t1 / gene=Cvel_23870 / organism=Chromera_velia_CCMP2878 / gene_product=hypothetical protein / transcript_product=hypothetical protein / location=Cvel_scaffold2512:9601-10202(-) / protein_length=82 / sequence_SO=supercontig / SO=protein_coding / is_pseudo=false
MQTLREDEERREREATNQSLQGVSLELFQKETEDMIALKEKTEKEKKEAAEAERKRKLREAAEEEERRKEKEKREKEREKFP